MQKAAKIAIGVVLSDIWAQSTIEYSVINTMAYMNQKVEERKEKNDEIGREVFC